MSFWTSNIIISTSHLIYIASNCYTAVRDYPNFVLYLVTGDQAESESPWVSLLWKWGKESQGPPSGGTYTAPSTSVLCTSVYLNVTTTDAATATKVKYYYRHHLHHHHHNHFWAKMTL